MNRPRIQSSAEMRSDPHRPELSYWGPVMLCLDGILMDWASSALVVLERQSCPICGSPETEGLGVVYGWPVHECRRCGVGFVAPPPTEQTLEQFYGAHYWNCYSGDARPLIQREAIRRHILERQADFLTAVLRGNREKKIADFGAGDGSMLRILRERGFQNLIGVELHPENAQRASALSGCPVLSGGIEALRGYGGHDVITMWAVVEHLRDPLSVIAKAVESLGQEGLLVVMTGDNSSFAARMQGCFDTWMYPPEHLFFFDRRSVAELLYRAGCRHVRVRLGFQNAAKELVLWAGRLRTSAEDVIRKKVSPRWRSTSSNLIVAVGKR